MHMKVAAVLDLKIEKYDMTANDQLENNQVDLLKSGEIEISCISVYLHQIHDTCLFAARHRY